MRALLCNRETTCAAGVGGGVAVVVPGCRYNYCLWGGALVVMPRGCLWLKPFCFGQLEVELEQKPLEKLVDEP